MPSTVYESIAIALPVIGPAAITGLVALVTVHLTNRGSNKRLLSQLSHEMQKSGNEMRRTKGEELYMLVVAWAQNFGAQCVTIQSVMKGVLTYNEALDIQAKEIVEIAHDRIEMIVAVYFCELKQELDRVNLARDKVLTLLHYHREKYRHGETDGRPLLKSFTEANLALMSAIESLKQATIVEIRSIK